ncbi:MAG: glycoside hydrolase family 3 protein, partial [Lachnospiraceae bacterium]|nr:glycoside hydrolase family 3 protein [Lachnospiraceae bacterium]
MDKPKNTLGMLIVLGLIVMALCACAAKNLGKVSESLTEAEIKAETKAGSDNEPEKAEKAEKAADPLDEYISHMTLREKAAQLIMIALDRSDENAVTGYDEELEESLKSNGWGGVILFTENITTEEGTKLLTSFLQDSSEVPLFIATDEEGGRVSRLSSSGGIKDYYVPRAADIKTPEEAFAAGQTIGKKLYELGINVDFAPVADVNTNPQNPVIGDRSYSSDPYEAALLAKNVYEGIKGCNVLATAKHFPGHGDTSTDTHGGSVYVMHDIKRLTEIEFVPFEALIDDGIEMVMVSHIKTPNATGNDMEASLSKEIITGILRVQLGFKGIVITDAMNMKAIAENYSSKKSAVLAIKAGADIVLMPPSPEEALLAITSAVESGRISEERLNESVKRILNAKIKLF